MRLLFSLPYWVYFILSAFAVLLAYQMYTFQAKDIAERAEALKVGPPAIVELADFNKAEHAGPADEVFVRAQLDTSMSYELTLTKKGTVKRRAHMLPLYPVGATSTEEPPAALLFDESDELDEDALFAVMVDVGEVGPIIELNGLLVHAGKLNKNITGAFEEQNRAYKSGVPLIDPFLGLRTETLSEEKLAAVDMLYLFGGVALFLLIIGLYKMRRRKARA